MTCPFRPATGSSSSSPVPPPPLSASPASTGSPAADSPAPAEFAHKRTFSVNSSTGRSQPLILGQELDPLHYAGSSVSTAFGGGGGGGGGQHTAFRNDSFPDAATAAGMPDIMPGTESDDPINSWRNSMDPNLRRIFENIRIDIEKMETNVRQAENEVFRKEEEAFFARQDEIELNQLQQRQANEVARTCEAFTSMLTERHGRKHTKRLQKQMSKEAKARDAKIRMQETGKHMAREVTEMLAQHRHRFEALVMHLEARHARQRHQLVVAQERKIRDQRALLEIESRGLRDDLRAEVIKDFSYRINHQQALDKHVADQLHEIQQHELKQRKERFDAEAKALEEVAHLRAMHKRKLDELESRQKVEYATENERIEDAREKIKLAQLAVVHSAELKKLKVQHKMALRMAMRAQRLRASSRFKKWREVLGQTEADAAFQQQQQQDPGASPVVHPLTGGMSSDMHMRTDSSSSVTSSVSGNGKPADNPATMAEDLQEQRDAEHAAAKMIADEQARLQEQLTKLMEQLKVVVARQKDELRRLRKEQADELRAMEEDIQKRLNELDAQQDTEMRGLRKAHESVVMEVLATQHREYSMDAHIRANERKMLTERRTLNSVLDAVLDAIITIDPQGSIMRFNPAAENMFGYSASEVLGKNIKMLTPDHIAVNHDKYLLNYHTTGIKKVIGVGRTSKGRKKDGSLFPIHLSVSEVKEEEFHLFTGIVRDLTEQTQIEEAARSEQARKQTEMESLIAQLDAERTRTRSLIGEILPSSISDQLMTADMVPPMAYDQCTILYTDICGFTSLASQSEPLDIVDLLNDLYTCFDDILAQYDVQKIETVGDCYVICSGVPRPNGDRHYSEMAKLALHLLKAINTIRIRHRPDVVLKMRIGMHSGPVVAGVVGRKMPRYTLFGDSNTIANKLESTGLPMKVHISEATYEGLEQLGGFHFEARGDLVIPGHGTMKSYWLVSKDGFDPVVPTRDMLSASPISAFAKRSNSSVNAMEQHHHHSASSFAAAQGSPSGSPGPGQ
ncbi:Retinal guanylyl cyclase 2 [Allomyces arbusculus]|nr:Retinal guanylyl cyclase 2 [Allomyces arbusculus]